METSVFSCIDDFSLFYASGSQGLGVEEEGGSRPAAEVERGEGKVEAQQGDRIPDEVRYHGLTLYNS